MFNPSRTTRGLLAVISLLVGAASIGCDFIVTIHVQNRSTATVTVALNDHAAKTFAPGASGAANPMAVNERLRKVEVVMQVEPEQRTTLSWSTNSGGALAIDGPPLRLTKRDCDGPCTAGEREIPAPTAIR